MSKYKKEHVYQMSNILIRHLVSLLIITQLNLLRNDLHNAIEHFFKKKIVKVKKDIKIVKKPIRKYSTFKIFCKEQLAIMKENERSSEWHQSKSMTYKQKVAYIVSLWKQELSKRIEDDIEN